MLDALHQILEFAAVLLGGAIVTVQITAGAFVVACVFGLLLSIVQLSKVPPLRFFVNTYVELFRGIPALTWLFIIYFGLAEVGIRFDSITAGIIGLGLIGAAILTEVFRAGFQALHYGQREAALAVGMTPLMAVRYIILPQAARIVLPPIGNYSISLLKETSIASAIAAPEIMFFARQLVTITFETTLIYLIAAILYLSMAFPMAKVVEHYERKWKTWV